jgi:hypothetical protein
MWKQVRLPLLAEAVKKAIAVRFRGYENPSDPKYIAYSAFYEVVAADTSFRAEFFAQPRPIAALRRGSGSRWGSLARGRLAKTLTGTFDHLFLRCDRWKAHPGRG